MKNRTIKIRSLAFLAWLLLLSIGEVTGSHLKIKILVQDQGGAEF